MTFAAPSNLHRRCRDALEAVRAIQCRNWPRNAPICALSDTDWLPMKLTPARAGREERHGSHQGKYDRIGVIRRQQKTRLSPGFSCRTQYPPGMARRYQAQAPYFFFGMYRSVIVPS